ncbi:MAG: hypothetical protein LBH91_09170 [Prevotellaceae bacterium]|jgi:hypothetical protein|nr:hypothetical protein [Prevotellaceae bacterium]
MKNIFVFLVLPVAIIVLAYLFIRGIGEPVRFEQDKKFRQERVAERLKDIRDVQVAYKSQYGKFAESFDSLITFYNHGKLKIVKQIGSMDDSVAVAQKLVKREIIEVPVRENIKLRTVTGSADSLRFVPVVGGEFEMEAMIKRVSGVDVPLFEARVSYDRLLAGLNRQLVVNINAEVEEINKTLTTGKRYSGVKVGSVEQPNNNAGNWE